MLFLKCKGLEEYLKPFLLFLGILPDKIENLGIENRTIYTTDINMNTYILEELRKI
jgi:hypothetical protein